MKDSIEVLNKIFSDDFFVNLANYLHTLPNYNDADKREDSFKTAEEIKEWAQISCTPGEIDAILLKRWGDRKLNNIRPAKYPHQTKLVRLWGHIDNLWPMNENELQPYSNDEIVALPDYNLPKDAANIFVSFNSFDRELVIEIRERFVKWGWQTWLYINQIQKGATIIDEVMSAVSDCKAAMVLVTPTSIGSAWVYTEFTSLTTLGKPVIAIFDATKKELTDVLETWKRDERYSNTYCEKSAAELVRLYRENKGNHHIEGYETTIKAFLSQLSFFDMFAMYPKRPANWSASADFIDFAMLKNNLHF